jgi:putative ABC transport system permease protein
MFTELNALPGITEVSAASAAPFEDHRSVAAITINGAPAVIENRPIWNNYFETAGTQLIEGRAFTAAEVANASHVMIINQTMARKYWPGQSAMNRRVSLDGRTQDDTTIIGVSADVRQLGLAVTPPPMYYTPLGEETDLTVLIRTAQKPSMIAPEVRKNIREIDKGIAVNWIQPMQSLIDASLEEQRYRALLISVFAVTAVGLAVVGLYSVVSRYVAYRTSEFAVRVAVGAKPQSILRLILQKGLVLTLAGVCIGGVAASGLTRVLSDYLFGITPLDARTYAAVTLLLGIVSLLAVLAPAMRASRTDPIQYLRGDLMRL